MNVYHAIFHYYWIQHLVFLLWNVLILVTKIILFVFVIFSLSLFFHFFLIKFQNKKKNNKIKIACNSLCQKCNGPLSTNCVACPNSKYLFNGECLDDCPFGYFISGSQCQGPIFVLFFCFRLSSNKCNII